MNESRTVARKDTDRAARPRRATAGVMLSLGVFLTNVACDDTGTDPVPTQVAHIAAVSPEPNSLTASTDQEIIVRFRDPIDPATFDPHAITIFGRWSGVAGGTWELADGNRVARLHLSTRFAAGELVTVSIARNLAGGYAWYFWTRAAPGTVDLEIVREQTTRSTNEGLIRSYGAYAGDFDGDGFSDLMIPNEDVNDVRIFLNDGTGDYAAFSTYPIPGGDTPSANEGADFNGDGFIDFVVANGNSDLVSVFLGDGAGGFQHSSNYQVGSSVRAVCVLDLDFDGHTDIVTASRFGGASGIVSTLLNDGTGNFMLAQTIETSASSETACAVSDANGDGIPDVFIGAIQSEQLVLLLGNGNGRLTLGPIVSVGGGPWMIAAGDVNGDGAVDVVSANTSQDNFSVIFGDGEGGFGAVFTYPTGGGPLAIDLGDLDGDGDLDVVTSNFDTADFTIFENDGSGTFFNPRTLLASSAGSCAILHDRDNDGDLDMTGVDEIDDLLFLFENR